MSMRESLRRSTGDLRDADAAERLLQAATALLALTERIPHRGRLADLLEAWRGGLDAAGFWNALEQEPLEALARDRQLAAFSHDGFWQPMDTYREFTSLNALWAKGAAPWKVWSD